MRQKDNRTIFGVTLSKRAWNNVLVYVVLLLMFLFWFSAPDSPPAGEQSENGGAVQLMPPESGLQSIRIGDQQITLSEQGWQCQAPCSLSKQQAASLASVWLNLKITPSQQQPDQRLVDVQLGFVDNQQAVVELYTEPELLLRLPQQDKVYQPVNVTIEQLLGR
ncbi:MAG: hypothetical protein ACQEQZ_08345 [Pseudomonadota bacterium]